MKNKKILLGLICSLSMFLLTITSCGDNGGGSSVSSSASSSDSNSSTTTSANSSGSSSESVSIDESSWVNANSSDKSCSIELTNPEGCFYISSSTFSTDMVGERVHLKCSVAASTKHKFLNSTFLDDNGLIIDGCLPASTKRTLQTDGTIKKIGDRLAIEVAYKNAINGEGIELSDFVFSQDTLDPLHSNLGGNKLYMMKHLSSSQMESFVFLTSTNKVVVVDGGSSAEAENLYTKIVALGGVVDSWYLSHYHCDHIDALITILKTSSYSNIHINKLYYDFWVDSDIVSQYGDEDNHCLEDLENALKGAPKMVDQVIIPHKGDINVVDDGLSILVLNDAKYLASSNMPNNSSVLLKAITKKSNILFCQDMGSYGDTLIEDSWFKKEISDCLFVQTAHHGQSGVSQEFYQCCLAARIALFEAGSYLFDDETGLYAGSGPWTSLETRDWLRELGIRYYFLEEEETVFD